jgi:hypothetical protein
MLKEMMMRSRNSRIDIRNPKRLDRFRILSVALRISLLLCPALMATPASAQDVVWGKKKCPPPCPPSATPTPSEKPPLEIPPEQPPSVAEPPTEPMLSAERAGAFGSEMVALAAPNMIGDFLAPSCGMRTVTTFIQTPPTVVPGTPGTPGTPGIPGLGFPPEGGGVQVIRQPVPGTPATPGTPGFTIPGTLTPITATFFVPSESHSFKVADNESAIPQDRLIGAFNFYNFVEGQANARMGANVGNVNFYREIVGFEKTFFDGYASIGMRLPFDLLDVGGINQQSADAGDLSIIFKGVFLWDRDAGYIISGGLGITVPTGPVALGGAGFALDTFHSTLLQPWVGMEWVRGNFFIQGFSAIDVPIDPNDVTFFFNDLGVGYYVFRDRSESGFITGFAPTIEVHVNTPLNHREPSADCLVGLPDWVDLTGGFTVEFNRRSTLAVGVAAPVTGPKPYAMEAITQLNIRF